MIHSTCISQAIQPAQRLSTKLADGVRIYSSQTKWLDVDQNTADQFPGPKRQSNAMQIWSVPDVKRKCHCAADRLSFKRTGRYQINTVICW